MGAGEFALVEEGDGEEGGAEDEEGKDAVDAVEEGEVVEEDFNGDDAQEDEGLPAEERPLTLHAEDEEESGVDGPEDGDGEMLSERVGDVARAAEEVPELEAEGEERKEVDGDGKESDFGGGGVGLGSGGVRCFVDRSRRDFSLRRLRSQ